MKCIFETCSEAIEFAARSSSFGGYYSEAQNPNPNIHIHDCCEVFFCLSGGKNFLIGNRLYEVSDNDIFVINQFEAHKITFDPGRTFARYVLQISPDFIIGSSTPETDLKHCFYPHDESFVHHVNLSKTQADDYVYKLSMLSSDYGYGDDVVKKNIMLGLLVDINRLFMSGDVLPLGYPVNKYVRRAIDYIDENFTQELSLEIVAKNSFLSVNQLCRLFSKYCGTTVAKYIVSKRITEAKKMLASGLSVTETALRCGFGDYSCFIRVFSKNVGMTPGKYRSLCSGDAVRK